MAYTLMDKEYDRTLTKRGMAAFFSHIVAGNKKWGNRKAGGICIVLEKQENWIRRIL